ncbi:WxL domain-containing protein [Vagococcus lutrae]|uniref:WxL domain-containing protein n=1 Tax=Vagococcus lutrae TaxID=81947 RepID=UPI00200EEAF2|nr:WxL domain-containing protein [Vagococcus lutrae]UQF23765.1 WxL domain-containing protein [Vagococcus lutrae]UQF64144.1 WxL domain-containing protein [Vagococcus lutrae]
MKKSAILSAVLASTIILGGVTSVSAAKFDSSLKATSEAKVQFTKPKTPEIVDPDNPEKPVTPVDPKDPDNPDKNGTNPNNDSELLLKFVPEFDFGEHEWSAEGFEANAKSIQVRNKDGEIEERAPFVVTQDLRTKRGNGWKLQVSSDGFKHKESDNELIGAEIVFTNASYGDQKNRPKVSTKAEQKDLTEGFSVTKDSETLAHTDLKEDSNSGQGIHSLKLGDLIDGNLTDGVTFKLAPNTPASTGEYQATLNWELVTDVQ